MNFFFCTAWILFRDAWTPYLAMHVFLPQCMVPFSYNAWPLFNDVWISFSCNAWLLSTMHEYLLLQCMTSCPQCMSFLLRYMTFFVLQCMPSSPLCMTFSAIHESFYLTMHDILSAMHEYLQLQHMTFFLNAWIFSCNAWISLSQCMNSFFKSNGILLSMSSFISNEDSPSIEQQSNLLGAFFIAILSHLTIW